MKSLKKIKSTYNKLTLLFFHLIVLSFFAQKPIPNLNYLTTENGLSQAHNLDIFKDKQGFLWLSSYDGLNRFDGHMIKKYTQIYGDDKSFSGTLSNGIVEDSLGNIWSGSNNCLNVLYEKRGYFKQIKIDNQLSSLYKPLFANDKYVVFQKGSNYYQCDIKTHQTKLIYLDNTEEFIKNISYVIALDDTIIVFQTNKDLLGNVFEKTKFKILVFNKKTLKLISSFYNKQDIFAINEVISHTKNELLLATYEGLKTYNLFTNTIEDFQNELLNLPILALSNYDKNHYFFINDEAECFTLTKDFKNIVKHSYNNEEDLVELKKKGVRKIFVDKEQNVFMSIWGKGIAYFNFNNSLFLSSFNSFQLNNKIISDRYICSIANHHDKGVWVATRTGGLYHVNNKGQILKTIPYPKKLREIGYSGDIYLFNGFNDELLITTTSGFFYLLKNTIEIKELNIGEAQKNLSFYDIHQWYDNKYLVSTNEGMVLMNDQLKNITKINGLPQKGIFIRSYGINDQFVIICQPYKGFEVYKKENDIYKKYDNYNINASIKAMHYIDDNEIYFASTVGLIKYHLKSKKKIIDNHPDKWVNTYMYSVLADKRNNLWISHNNGVSRINLTTNVTEHFDNSNGLQGNEFNTTAYFKKNDDEFYLGGTNGLNIFNPNDFKVTKKKTSLVLQNFRVLDKVDTTVYYLKNHYKVQLPANQNSFSFTPILIQFQSTFSNKEFLYKIDGIDNNWIKGISHQDIRFAGLPAGNHQLIVKTKDNTQLVKIDIYVAQSIWKTWWFWLLFTIVLFILGYFTTRGYYKAKIIKQQAELDNHKALSNERLRIAQDMHDDVGTGLSRIRYIINALKKEEKIKFLDLAKIAEISDDTITKMGEIIWGLNESNQTLEELIFFIRANVSEMIENVNINFLSEMPQTIPHCQLNWNQNRNIYLLVKETVNNAIKHAKAQTITLSVKLHKYLEITIKDDGVGFDSSATYQGNGLKNYKKRIAKLGATYQINSDANGTIIIYQIPLSDKA